MISSYYCLLYGDIITPAMEYAISETKRRRAIQNEYNEKNGIIPKTIQKAIKTCIEEYDLAYFILS